MNEHERQEVIEAIAIEKKVRRIFIVMGIIAFVGSIESASVFLLVISIGLSLMSCISNYGIDTMRRCLNGEEE